ncbi:MAG: P1 family peptidase [Rhodobacteraceae bacterium]|nr:P1 family peptidase [Paracoccaceae bacterium]
MSDPFRPAARNLITDVAGLLVGNAHDPALRSGVTVLRAEQPFTAAVQVLGGAPGTRETDLLAPDKLVSAVDALVLSGGSAFGLEAAAGATEALRAQGRGFAVGDMRVPIVPAAILFDLTNGGAQDWTDNPWRPMGRAACDSAAEAFQIGSAGAGFGATVAGLRGGLGSASVMLEGGLSVGALVAVNALGAVTVGDGPHFWAAPFELEGEFGALGPAPRFPPALPPRTKRPGGATTIAIVATDAALDKAGCQRLATAAHDGIARAVVPAHTPMDGDLVFGVATGLARTTQPPDPLLLGHAAALCLSRAIARGVHAAAPSDGIGPPSWAERFAAATSN